MPSPASISIPAELSLTPQAAQRVPPGRHCNNGNVTCCAHLTCKSGTCPR
jgi:hypothetical protein